MFASLSSLALLLALFAPTDPVSDPVQPPPGQSDSSAAAETESPYASDLPPLGFLDAWLESAPLGTRAATSAVGEEDDGSIEVGEGLKLFLGGQERLRFMREDNMSLTGTTPNVNTYYLNRLFVHADLRSENGWRVYVEAIDARISSNNRPPVGIDRNDADLRNAFFEITSGDTTSRVGRTDLKYGAERLISPLDWANTRRTFDAAVVSQDLDGDKVDVFVSKPVKVDPHNTDHDDDSLWFSGVYTTWLGDNGEGGVDVYALALNEQSDKFVGNKGQVGKMDLYTLGARAWHKADGFDADFELAHQFGERARDSIEAAMIAAKLGHTWTEAEYKPRIGIDFDWASGDDSPTDSNYQTFNQLFPLAHAYLGYLDLVGRQNIQDISPNASLQLDERSTLRVAFHDFKLDEKLDALYSVGGAATLRDPTGRAGDNVGQEWDLTLSRNVKDEVGFLDNLLFGYSYFTPGRFVASQRTSDRTKLLYMQATAFF